MFNVQFFIPLQPEPTPDVLRQYIEAELELSQEDYNSSVESIICTSHGPGKGLLVVRFISDDAALGMLRRINVRDSVSLVNAGYRLRVKKQMRYYSQKHAEIEAEAKRSILHLARKLAGSPSAPEPSTVERIRGIATKMLNGLQKGAGTLKEMLCESVVEAVVGKRADGGSNFAAPWKS